MDENQVTNRILRVKILETVFWTSISNLQNHFFCTRCQLKCFIWLHLDAEYQILFLKSSNFLRNRTINQIDLMRTSYTVLTF